MAHAHHAKEKFSNYYILLKPKHGSCLDLLRLLWSEEMGKNKLVHVSEGLKIANFKSRFVMFSSALAQKALHLVDKPLAWSGSMFEMWLNLLSANRNFAVLLLRRFRGNLVIPDKTSASFKSMLGHLDGRVALDKNIKSGDSRYIAELSIMASKVSYENEAFIKDTVENQWQMEYLGFYDFWNDSLEQFSTQAFMLYDRRVDIIVVAFRGTSPFDATDWTSDVDISLYELPNIKCKVHSGFMKALGLQKEHGWPKEINEHGADDADKNRPKKVAYYSIREKLKRMLGDNYHKDTKFILTGHSLGGALAILFPMVLLLHEETELLKRLEGVYTFGQPRVGDEKLSEFMNEKLMGLYGVKYFRFVYSNDIVPRLPFDDKTFSFKHFGTCVYYNSFYHGKIVKEEPNKNYLSLKWLIPEMINAAWELVRSFIIEYWKGPDYAEGWFVRMFRVLGLVIPGLADHILQDYVNAIRLGSPLLLSSQPLIEAQT